jgi:hypothetical protein
MRRVASDSSSLRRALSSISRRLDSTCSASQPIATATAAKIASRSRVCPCSQRTILVGGGRKKYSITVMERTVASRAGPSPAKNAVATTAATNRRTDCHCSISGSRAVIPDAAATARHAKA